MNNFKTVKYLKENIVFDKKCNRCGTLVLNSDLDGYKYQCLSCDEDLLEIETTLISCDDEKLVDDVVYLYERAVLLLCLDD